MSDLGYLTSPPCGASLGTRSTVRILLLLALAHSLAAQDKFATHVATPVNANEIRKVLLLARDAVLEQEQADHGMQGGWLPDHLQTLMAGFRTIDDWQDAVVLEERISRIHKVDVLYAPPHATRADYQKLQEAAQQLEKYDRDNGLRRIISQQLEDGFIEDAGRVAASISDPRIQSDAYTDIALFLWKQDKKDAATLSFQSATDAAVKIQTSFGLVDTTLRQAEQLTNIAEQRFQTGDKSGAIAILVRLKAMAEHTDGYLHSSLCETAVLTQANLGLFDEARASANCIDSETNRKSIENRISYQEILQSEPGKAIAMALRVSDRENRLKILSEIGSKQVELGNQAEATIALDEAMKAFQELPAQDGMKSAATSYRLRLIAISYLDSGDRDKGKAVLQRLRVLKQETASPRDQYDFLTDLAIGYASFALFDEAHGFVSEMREYPDEYACNVVAYLQAKQGQTEQAVRWATLLKAPSARASALVGIAEAMLEPAQKPPTE